MAGEPEVQVSQFLDEYGVGSFHFKLLFWTVLLALVDGYDIGAIAFAAPSLIKEWHLAPKRPQVGTQRQQFRRPVWIADLRLDRRPLWPQIGAY